MCDAVGTILGLIVAGFLITATFMIFSKNFFVNCGVEFIEDVIHSDFQAIFHISSVSHPANEVFYDTI